jgi:hypothetical protein
VRYVERVAQAYGAATVACDADYGAGPSVRILEPEGEGADLVVSVDPASRGASWAEHVARLGRLARKALVVIVPNADRGWPLARETLSTVELASVLWQVGRVRERAYLSVPRLAAGLGVPEESQVPVGPIVRRTARWQAYVVDTAPRTPQARRRLRTVGRPPGGAT